MPSFKPDPEAQPRGLGVNEFQANIVGILRQVRQGRSFLIMSQDEVVAELRPPSERAGQRRRPGALRGKIRLASDFDELTAGVIEAMEGDA